PLAAVLPLAGQGTRTGAWQRATLPLERSGGTHRCRPFLENPHEEIFTKNWEETPALAEELLEHRLGAAHGSLGGRRHGAAGRPGGVAARQVGHESHQD